MLKKLFKIALYKWRLKQGSKSYHILSKEMDQVDFIKRVNNKINNDDNSNGIISISLPIIKWEEWDTDYYNRVCDGWVPFKPSFLAKQLMRLSEFIKLVESRGTKFVDYDQSTMIGTFRIVKELEDTKVKNIKEFIAPISGTRFIFEQDSNNVIIRDNREVTMEVPQEDFIAFLNYVMVE